MLATAGLVLAAALSQSNVDPVPCDIEGYTERRHCDQGAACWPGFSVEICCEQGQKGLACFGNDDDGAESCRISHHYHCCGRNYDDEFGFWKKMCISATKTECDDMPNFEWCLPAEDSGLSAGATAGIVVGGILGPFALGLAYKSLM